FRAQDLGGVADMRHTIGVMYLGKIVEWGDAEAIALAPQHPYTQALFAAALPIDFDSARDELTLAGEVPSPLDPPAGCRFHPRCPFVMDRCAMEEPALRTQAGRLGAVPLYCGSAPSTYSTTTRRPAAQVFSSICAAPVPSMAS